MKELGKQILEVEKEMSWYITVDDFEKDTKVMLSNGTEMWYKLRVYYQRVAGTKELVVEIDGVNRGGARSSVVLSLEDILEIVGKLVVM